MRRNLFLISILVFVGIFQVGLATAQNMSIEEIVFCSSIENRQPVGVDSSFSSDVERIYCFTKLIGANTEKTVKHIWYFNDKKKAEIELTIKANPWRTWSSKKIVPSWTGNWRVDVVDDSGNVLASNNYSVIAK